MPNSQKRTNFFDSLEGAQVKQALKEMEQDSKYNTRASYAANVITHPNHLISFVDKHMKYLSEHQSIDLEHYLSNLRLMTRIR